MLNAGPGDALALNPSLINHRISDSTPGIYETAI
jgi:hypothetical protein